jgi:hypothetical protein
MIVKGNEMKQFMVTFFVETDIEGNGYPISYICDGNTDEEAIRIAEDLLDTDNRIGVDWIDIEFDNCVEIDDR